MINVNDPVVIVSAARTPMGGFQGELAGLSATQLGAVAVKAAVERAGLAAGDVQEAYTLRGKAGEQVIDSDEGPRRIKVEKIPSLRPAFRPEGTITAASSSSISDGAAALVLMRLSTAQRLSVRPLARIAGHSAHAQEAAWFSTAPVQAIAKLCRQTGWAVADVDLFEINEAFAVVPMAAMAEHGIARDRVNVHGGACALGHPIGASGARIVVTLLGALRHRGLRRGIATLCIGGGEATALAIELI